MKILVATDGSEYSRVAVSACCELVELDKNTSVRVVAVYEPFLPMTAEPFAVSAEHYHRLDEIAKENAKAAADEAVELIRRKTQNDSFDVTTVVAIGRPAEMIVDAAKEWNADLVVVGSHGRGFWGRLTLGSVSDAVLHHASCSVLVVRA
jgi:nucleotide-binding universal stress UspA family protein